MRPHGVLTAAGLALLGAIAASPVAGQRPDTMAKRDSAARTDSIARADSIFLAQQLANTTPASRAGSAGAATPAQGGTGAINPRLLPDVSAVGDLVGDLSPKHSTQEDQSRLGVREVEIAVQAAVDPYFRGDIFLGLSDAEGVSIEQAYLTATALPYALEARIGRFLMPVGKQNTTHRHDLHTVEYPYVIQRFFGPEGLKGTGVWASRIFAPLGFYQELQLTAVDRYGEAAEGLTTSEPVNRTLGGLAFSARLRNYWDLSQASNVELAATAITGRVEQPIATTGVLEFNAVGARQSVIGADFTYRWRPLQQGLYRSFIFQAELMRQLNERSPHDLAGLDDATFEGPGRDFNGAYAFARYQLTRRLFLGSRYDWLQDPQAAGSTFQAGSGYLEWFPSEFSKLVAAYERVMPDAAAGEKSNRLLLQAAFSLGPHKPHPF